MIREKITITEVVQTVFKKAERDSQEDAPDETEYSVGLDDGYMGAVEDFLIFLNNGDRNDMNRPEYYNGLESKP